MIVKIKKPGIGIIGAGMIAREHISNLRKAGGNSVNWVTDINEDILRETVTKFKIPAHSNDHRDLLNDPGTDAIIICTPPFTHLSILKDCIYAGKHVLIEKPACINKKEADEMQQLAADHPELLIMDASGRHARLQPKFNRIRKIIDSGTLGEIYYIHHNSVVRQFRPGIEYNPPAKWFLDRELSGGGPIIDWGVYDLSFHLGLFHDVPELKTVQSFIKSGLDLKDPGCSIFSVEEHGVVNMEFSNGLKYYWERASNANMEAPGETRIYGTRGGLKFSYITWEPPGIIHYKLDKRERARSRKINVNMDSHNGDHFEMMKHFLDVLHGKKDPIVSFDNALKHLKIIFRIYESAARQQTSS